MIEFKRIKWLGINKLVAISINVFVILFMSLFFIIMNDLVVATFLKQLQSLFN